METNNTYRALYHMAHQQLESSFEAAQLFAHVTQKRPEDLPFVGADAAPQAYWEQLEGLCAQRRGGTPLQYLLGEWEFYGLAFAVGRGVLIPRADTEALVEAALDKLADREAPEVLDLCAGSGCVAIAVADSRPGAVVSAVELSPDAYDYLTRNNDRHGNIVTPVLGDVMEYIHPRLLDVITSNPPYIPAGAIAGLQPELWFEPRMALSGGDDGLDFYRVIARRYYRQLKPGGWLCLEVGIDQSGPVAEILAQNQYREIDTRRDMAGIERVVLGRR